MNATISHTVGSQTYYLEVTPDGHGEMDVDCTQIDFGTGHPSRVGPLRLGRITLTETGFDSTTHEEATMVMAGELETIPVEHHDTLTAAIGDLASYAAAVRDWNDEHDDYLTRAQWRAGL